MTTESASLRTSLLDGLQVLGPLGADRDSTSFRAVREADGAAVELRILSGLLPQQADARHRRRMQQRLNRARLLEHPAVVRVLEVDWESTPPVALLEWKDRRPLADCVRDAAPEAPPLEFALKTAHDVASAVAAAHRLGLTHGHLSPSTVWLTVDGQTQIDFTANDRGHASSPDGMPGPVGEHPPGNPPGPHGNSRRIDTAHTVDLYRHVAGFADRTPAADEQPSVAAAAPSETLLLDDSWDPDKDAIAVSSLLLWLISPKLAVQPKRQDTSRATLLTALRKKPDDLVQTLCELVDCGTAADPSSRPSVAEIERCLHHLLAREGTETQATSGRRIQSESAIDQTRAADSAASLVLKRIADEPADTIESAGSVGCMLKRALDVADDALSPGDRLGRFSIRKKLGEGGMGTVYEAEDITTAETVAIKVLRPAYARQPQALRRFQREARLLAEVQHPNVVNLLEVNEDRGLKYLAMEFVAGSDLRHLLSAAPKLDESQALDITCHVLRGLAVAHERGIVHRDIKPANILLQMLQSDRRSAGSDNGEASLVKLSDFGLARDIQPTESLELTQTGMLLGTPHYMAPEQCAGQKEVTPAADIYAIGATLFHLLAGRPPFVANEVLELVDLHRFERPPSLGKLRPDVSEAVVRIVEKALAKNPLARYQDASQMLADVQGLLQGAPTTIEVHPVIPPHDSERLFRADFEYDLAASPEALWPYVSNTERINRAVGVPAVEYASKRDEHGTLHKYGDFRMAGLHIAWEELPFEWIEAQRLGVLREFSKGPFHWFLSVVETMPRAGGGTRLKHSVRIAPRGVTGRWVAKLEVNIKGKPKLHKVYHRIDEVISGVWGDVPLTDPFESPRPLSKSARSRLEERLLRVQRIGTSAPGVTATGPIAAEQWREAAGRLGEYLANGAPQALARIRPFEIARQWGIDREVMLDVCLRAAGEGLLELHWDLLCPTCRISADVKDTLREIEQHAYCEVCDLDFDLDFGNSIELIFRAHPEIRSVDLKTYCIGGPEHSPHVIAQVRLMAGERFELPLRLPPGTYLLRSPQLPYSVTVEVHSVRGVRQAEIELAPRPGQVPALHAGGQLVAVTNGFNRPILVRVERTIPRSDIVTAAQAATRPLFRELFPNESLDPSQLLTVSQLAFLAVDVENADALLAKLGDAGAYSVLSRYRRAVQRVVEEHGGVVFAGGSHGAAMNAVFDHSLHAIQAALTLSSAVRDAVPDQPLPVRAALHRGPALVITTEDRLDYFGQTLYHVLRLVQHARGGELLLSAAISSDPEVNAFLQDQQIAREVRSIPEEPLAQRVALAAP